MLRPSLPPSGEWAWPAHFPDQSRVPSLLRLDNASRVTLANVLDFGGDAAVPFGPPAPWATGACCEWPWPPPPPALYEGSYWWPWDGVAWNWTQWGAVWHDGALTRPGDRPVMYKSGAPRRARGGGARRGASAPRGGGGDS